MWNVIFESQLFHDSNSQYTIISRDISDKLDTKPPLHTFYTSQSGIEVDGFAFSFDGVVHLNLKLILINGNEYVVEYKVVLLSSKYQ